MIEARKSFITVTATGLKQIVPSMLFEKVVIFMRISPDSTDTDAQMFD